MDTDELLEEIGSFGFFQKRNVFFLGLIIFMLTFQTVSMVFIGGEPTWRCTPNSTICTRNETISAEDDYYNARCNMSSEHWEFTTEFTSIVTEWNLICGKEYYASLSQSILFIGWIPGAFIIGRLSDKFGRKRLLFPAVFCVVSTSFASSFVSVLWLFLALRGITGFFQGGVYITLYVLTTEFVGPKHRNIAGTLVWMFYTSSLIVLSGLAYGIRNWRNLSIVISAPAFPLLLLWWWVPESCRWLLVHNKVKEARKVFLSIAAVNKGKISEDKILCLENKVELRREERGIIDLVRSRKQLIKTSILWFTWERKIVLNNFYGRKRALISCLALAAIFCVIYSAILPSSDAEKGVATAVRITLAVLGKFCINASFSTIYVFSTELLPTVIRNVGMGSMAVFDQTGASVAPFVVLLGKTHLVIPFAVMSGFAFIAGCLCALLPETLGKPTPETFIEDISETDYQHNLNANEQPLSCTSLESDSR
ncbi:organic cation/carnitine transporter 4-like isoform X2 [Acropora millepora]|uniref:organic cation/carnitine transporter 4-like isoform X2 n=1 Tax=Acropora millepora TaxID=45264 RepID=UPI001CF58C20|nr:organic cation/carnitine transporter 4-like isoform X2 [Acropora millepora]